MKPGPQKIADGLWQCALAHVLPNWEQLQYEVDVIALMATLHEPLPSVPLVFFPIDDNAGGCDRLNEMMNLADMLKDKRVLTVCHMGENRSGLLSALILCARGFEPAEAVRRVQDNGPHNSMSQPHSFWNPGFVRQVSEL